MTAAQVLTLVGWGLAFAMFYIIVTDEWRRK